MLNLEELEASIRSEDIDTVIVAVCDLQGRLVGKRVTGWFFLEHAKAHGAHFCTYLLGTDFELNTPDGFERMNWSAGYGDFLAKPDWITLRRIPWLERTALVLADTVEESSGHLVEVAPRTVLRRQIERCQSLGYVPQMATELEFYLLLETYEAARARKYEDLRQSGWYNEDYQLLQSTKNEPLYRQFRNLLTEAGIPIEYSKGEAAPGQHEINIHYGNALESADRTVLLKHGLKEIAFLNDAAITFMAKPFASWTGSSGHIHVSLTRESTGDSAFVSDEDEVSELMRWFLGGLLTCTRDFAILFAPTVNSYKRFAMGSWAPVNLVWARDNRTCGLRVVGSGSSLRIENRFPGGDLNPYLAYASVLAAGIHGIEGRIEPPPAFEGNGYEAAGVDRVPVSLREAIEAFEQSSIAKQAFGGSVVDHYLNSARVEQEAFDRAVTDWERIRYFERG